MSKLIAYSVYKSSNLPSVINNIICEYLEDDNYKFYCKTNEISLQTTIITVWRRGVGYLGDYTVLDKENNYYILENSYIGELYGLTAHQINITDILPNSGCSGNHYSGVNYIQANLWQDMDDYK